MAPLVPPLHVTLVVIAEADNALAGCVTVVVAVDEQLLASVIVTVYVPATKPVLFWVVCAVFHK